MTEHKKILTNKEINDFVNYDIEDEYMKFMNEHLILTPKKTVSNMPIVFLLPEEKDK